MNFQLIASINRILSNFANFFSLSNLPPPAEPLSTRIEPRLVVSQENDQNVTINCTVQGHPIRKVSWLRNGQPIQSSARIRPYVDRLLFKQVKREDVSASVSSMYS